MRYVPRGEKTAWQDRAMAAAENADLGEFISLCVKAKEWERLARRVHSAKAEELESSAIIAPNRRPRVWQKRIPRRRQAVSGDGTAHRECREKQVLPGGLTPFRERARPLLRSGHSAEWQSLVGTVRVAHSRKSGFLSAFERIVSGKPHSSSYAEEAQARWKRLTS